MPVLFNQDSVGATPLAAGAARQVLLDETRTGNDAIGLERWTVAAGSAAPLSVAADGFAWLQLLAGAGELTSGAAPDQLTTDHIVLLPPGFEGRLAATDDAEVLIANVPRAARFDAAFATRPPAYRCLDWTREPVLDAEHDARKRIYMVTPKMFGTKAFKGEMIIYPPGTVAADHHHEGAEHFQYVVAGAGTVFLDGEPNPLRAGDVLYNYEFERHYFENAGTQDFIFVEFFVPGECKTVWAPGAEICAWLPTGKDIRGRQPAREIAAHSSEAVALPGDV